MNKTQQAIMASDLAYQKRLAHNNARLLIRADLAIKRVHELHQPDRYGSCSDCLSYYPCPTIRAIDGVQE